MKQAKYWALDAANTSYDNDTGAQTVTMMRTNAGQADIKVGGAAFGGFYFTDTAGFAAESGYLGWANDPDMSGATGVTTYAALVVAAVAALF